MAIRFTDEQTQEIERLALMNCNSNTIAEATGIAANTLRRKFGARLRHWYAIYRVNLRQSQDKLKDTSSDMSKFLGKNVLGQTDTQTIKTEAVLLVAPVDVPAVEAAAQVYKQFLAPMTKVIESKVIDNKELENV